MKTQFDNSLEKIAELLFFERFLFVWRQMLFLKTLTRRTERDTLIKRLQVKRSERKLRAESSLALKLLFWVQTRLAPTSTT